MKILITNTVALNGGDAAILFGTIRLLRCAFGLDTEFVVYDNLPEAARRCFPELNFRRLLYIPRREAKFPFRNVVRRIRAWRMHLAARCLVRKWNRIAHALVNREDLGSLLDYRSADLIVSTGGTYLVETYPLAPRIFDFKIALRFARPLVLFTQSLGPFTKRKNRRELRSIFSQASLILLRDEASRRNVVELSGQACRIHVCADAAFAMPCDSDGHRIAPPSVAHATGPAVAISVRRWDHFRTLPFTIGMKRFCDAIAGVTAHLITEHDAEVTFISTCQGVPEYWTDDSRVADDIVDRLSASTRQHVTIDRQWRRPEELTRQLASYDLVIATRMHMAILALLAGTPVLPIAYEFKTKELFARLRMNRWVQDIEEVDGQMLIQVVDAFVAAAPTMRDEVARRVSEEQRSATEVIDLVKDACERWSHERRGRGEDDA